MMEILTDLAMRYDWTVLNEYSVECPSGHVIEWDGECPSDDRGADCGKSIIRRLGLI